MLGALERLHERISQFGCLGNQHPVPKCFKRFQVLPADSNFNRPLGTVGRINFLGATEFTFRGR